jgi:uncharacterized protein DUF4043
MATTTVQTNNKLIKFRKEIYREFVRENMFSPYMGTGLTSIIRVLNDLKAGGEQVNVPLVARLAAAAIANGTLVGNEEAIDNYGCRFWIDWARNAVVTNKQEIHRQSADIFDVARPLLSDWGKELLKNEVIDAFNSVTSESAPPNLGTSAGQRVQGISIDTATAGQRNTWVSDNQDRVLFGASVSNFSATFATALANLDTTNDKFDSTKLRLMKRLAMKTNPRIRPYKTNEGYDFYVAFAGPNAFRDLANDSVIQNANQYARPRERGYEKNPLFNDGDLLFDGVIIRQVPEMDTRNPTLYATAGAGSTKVAPVFLCGQGAAAQFWGQMPKPTQLDQTDYQFKRGVGIEMAYGIGKLFKKVSTKLVDWGVFTGFFSAADDA